MSLKSGLKKIIGTVAPALATAIGGPLSGVAMKFIADKFTEGDTGKVEDFLLSANPEVLAQLKIADKQFQKDMKALDIDLERLQAEDRASARDLGKEKGLAIQATLSVSYTVGYFLTLASFVFGWAQVAIEYQDMTMTLIGALAAPQLQILNFWFGSSRGSSEKTQILAKNGQK